MFSSNNNTKPKYLTDVKRINETKNLLNHLPTIPPNATKHILAILLFHPRKKIIARVHLYHPTTIIISFQSMNGYVTALIKSESSRCTFLLHLRRRFENPKKYISKWECLSFAMELVLVTFNLYFYTFSYFLDKSSIKLSSIDFIQNSNWSFA